LNPALLQLPAAFGLAGATGLNATLPLLIVSLLARLGLIHLAPPYDALGSDIAFYGLLVLAVIEFTVDKVPALDSIGHAVMLPVAAAAGAILFASQTGAVSSVNPGLAVHVTRAAIRPVANMGLLGPPLSLLEDASSAVLSFASALIPILVPFLLLLLALGAMLLWERRRNVRPSTTGAR